MFFKSKGLFTKFRWIVVSATSFCVFVYVLNETITDYLKYETNIETQNELIEDNFFAKNC